MACYRTGGCSNLKEMRGQNGTHLAQGTYHLMAGYQLQHMT